MLEQVMLLRGRASRLAGFTLMELLVVVAIIGIIATLAFPSFKEMRDRANLKYAAERIYMDMQSAKFEAVKRNTRVYVSVSAGASWCVGVGTASSCNCGTASSCNVSQYGVAEYPGVSLTSTLSAAGASQFFDPVNGGFTGVGSTCLIGKACSGSVTVTKAGVGSIQVQVYSAGRASACGDGRAFSEVPACQ